MRIRDLCELLADAFELQGVGVRKNLRPGLSRESIQELVAPTGIVLPESVIQLYEWADGHIENEDCENAIVFRDNTFVSLSWAVREYFDMQSAYGVPEATMEVVRVEFDKCFPISLNNGSWDAVVCGRHAHHQALSHPIIRVFQGYDLYFDSIEAMLKTCISWVRSPLWQKHEGLRREIEREIWNRENPIRALGPN